MSERYHDHAPEARPGGGPESSPYENYPQSDRREADAQAIGHTALSGTVEQPND